MTPRELPILFQDEMVRAILDGRKTVTRRVVKPQPDHRWNLWLMDDGRIEVCRGDHGRSHDCDRETLCRCPYGQPGDLLYVREAFIHSEATYVYEASTSVPAVPAQTFYRADEPDAMPGQGWSPSIHMPKALARIWLEVTNVRVERVQEISEADAKAEGISTVQFRPDDGFPVCDGYMVGKDDGQTALHPSPCGAFRALWDSINESRGYSWDTNPWVWVVSFRRVDR